VKIFRRRRPWTNDDFVGARVKIPVTCESTAGATSLAWARVLAAAILGEPHESTEHRARFVLSAGSDMVAPVDLVQLIGPERLAFLRQMALVPLDWTNVVPQVRPGDDVVVLVHGFCATAGVFRPLRARLETEAGARVATFTHAPGVGVRRIARQLERLIDRLPASARITVVGHSLGGVVARWYVQEMGGHRRVVRTISMASPFSGVAVPPLLVGVDLHEQSALLKRLREGARSCGVPHTSIVAGLDTVVPGTGTACLGAGDVLVMPQCGHNELLFDAAVAQIVIDRVRRSRGTDRRPLPGARAAL